jgi:porin
MRFTATSRGRFRVTLITVVETIAIIVSANPRLLAAEFSTVPLDSSSQAYEEHELGFAPLTAPLDTNHDTSTWPDQTGVENTPEGRASPANENPAAGRSAEDAATAEPFAARNFDESVLILRADHLFGDWCGYRTQLEAGGVTPSITFVTDMLGNPVGGVRRGFTEADNLGGNLLFDLNKLYCIEGGSFFMSASQRSGASLSADYIGNTFTTQQVFGGSTFKVVDLAYKQSLADDDIQFQIGRIAAGDDFLVSPYNYIYVQNGFCGNPVGIFLNSPGMSGYPNATWGTLLKVRPTDRTYVQGGVYNGDPTIRDSDNHGLDLSLSGPGFVIVEAAYQTNQLKGDAGLPGNFRIGSWFDGNDFSNLEAQALAAANPAVPVSTHEGNYGVYALCDQLLVRFGSPSEKIMRGLGVVGSIVVSPDQSISQMPYFFNAGIAARGLDPDRPRDVAAFGVVLGEFSDELRRGQRQAQLIDPTIGVQDHETALELTYIFRFKDGAFFIQPDMQYIIRPSGTGDIPNALVLGTQMGINF